MGESCARNLNFLHTTHLIVVQFLCTRFILIPCERVIQMLCD